MNHDKSSWSKHYSEHSCRTRYCLLSSYRKPGDTSELTPGVFFQSLPSEIEVKYKIAECYTILKLDKDAIAVLDGIPSRQRTPKVGGCSPKFNARVLIEPLFNVCHQSHDHTEGDAHSGRVLRVIAIINISILTGSLQILCESDLCDTMDVFCLWLQINMMLANLYRKAGQERSAVTSYKEVLRQCPLALDAIIGTERQRQARTRTHTLSNMYVNSS